MPLCPSCARAITAPIQVEGAIVCPNCGARLKKKGRPPAPAGAATPAAASADASVPGPAAVPPTVAGSRGESGPPARSGDRRRRSTKPAVADLPGVFGRLAGGRRLEVGIGIALLLVAAVFVGVGLTARRGGGGGLGGGRAVVEAPVPALALPEFGPFAPPPPSDPPSVGPPRLVVPRVPAAAWNVEPDPAATEVEEIDPGRAGLPRVFPGPPLLAAREGPFLLDTSKDFRPPANGPTPDAPVSVIDLRNGRAEGTFSGKSPWVKGRLSPDGLYLVGPDTAPGAPATVRQGRLFSWKRNEDRPAAELKLAGILLWMDFLAADRLATVTLREKATYGPQRAIRVVADQSLHYQVWDVASGQSVVDAGLAAGDVALRKLEGPPGNVSLPTGGVAPTEQPTEDELVEAMAGNADPLPTLVYAPSRLLGALTPGGRFVALGGREGVTILDAATGAVKGRLPLPGPRGRLHYHGFGFSDDGRALFALVNLSRMDPNSQTVYGDRRLLCWSLADGHLTSNVSIGDVISGRILPGPIPGTLLVAREDPWSGSAAITPLHDLNEPSEGAAPAWVVDESSGLTVARLPYSLDRRIGRGNLLCHGRWDAAPANVARPRGAFPEHRGVWSYRLDADALAAIAGRRMESIAPRPAVAEADRSALRRQKAEPPAAWSVPPPAQAAPSPAAGDVRLPEQPTAWADAEVAILVYSRKLPGKEGDHQSEDAYPRVRVAWRRFGLRDGKPIGDPIALWPWVLRTDGSDVLNWTEPSVAALTVSGDRLALRDPADPSRVDAWDSGGRRLAGFRPYGEPTPVDWLGWAGEGRLLTIGGGKLTAWELPACKALYELDGSYKALAFFPPGRAWVAAAAGPHMDLVSTADGRVLGRCGARDGVKKWPITALSPDGKTLLRVGGSSGMDRATGKAVPQSAAYGWNLKTGALEVGPVVFGGPTPREVFWCGVDRFLADTGYYDLVDLGARASVCRYRFPNDFLPPPPGGPLTGQPRGVLFAGEPSGRVWLNRPLGAGRVWGPLAVPDPLGKVDAPLAAADRSFPFRPGVPLRIEADLNDVALSKKLAARLAALLQVEGHAIGRGGWTLRVSSSRRESEHYLLSPSGARQTQIPYAEFRYDLVAPDGAVAWTGTADFGWASGLSRYRVKRDAPERYRPGDPPQNVAVTEFEFGFAGVQSSIYAEILEQSCEPKVLPRVFPAALLSSGGKIEPVPLNAEFRTAGP